MPSRDRPAPLVLVATPADPVGEEDTEFGSYAAVARAGQRLLAADLSRRLGRIGAAVVPLPTARPPADEAFHWGRWFAAGARQALDAAGGPVDVLGYAGSGALPLLGDVALDDLASPIAGEVVANNRFSADAFVVAADERGLARAVDRLEACPSDNAAPRWLEGAGFSVRDLGDGAFARFDVDTPLDLALLGLGAVAAEARRPDESVTRFVAMARLPANRRLEVPELDRIGAVMRDRNAELVVAGRIPSDAWAHLETQTACRVRCLVEERGMRSATTGGPPRSILAALMRRSSPGELVGELAALGDAVILDTRVLMAALAGSARADAWPPEEERFASDFGDAGRIGTAWLRELVEAAAAQAVPFLLGGHALVSDGLRLIVAAAWHGR
jgi:hypothetical protein